MPPILSPNLTMIDTGKNNLFLVCTLKRFFNPNSRIQWNVAVILIKLNKGLIHFLTH